LEHDKAVIDNGPESTGRLLRNSTVSKHPSQRMYIQDGNAAYGR
jgi:hypothetical protein